MEYQTPSFDEIQAATLLVHECCDLGSDPEAWQMHLLNGLRTLLNAPVALLHKAAGLGRLGEDGKPEIITAIHLGFDQRQEDAFREFTQTYDVRHCPLEQALARRMRVGSVFTARESEILDAQTWWNSHLVKNYLGPVGLPFMLAARYISLDGIAYSLILQRRSDEPEFSEKERDLLHLCFMQMASVLGSRLVDPTHTSVVDRMRPRERDVLYLFLQHMSERQVASELGISPHTVRDYGKRLNLLFEVRSREQLVGLTHHLLPVLQLDFDRRHGV